MRNLQVKRFKNLLYWLLVWGIWSAQAVYTFQSLDQIRLEELSESIRNVYWLQNRTIYDGISSNVGWYGTLLVIYNIFGFSLFRAKFFRLILHAFFLISLALILKKYLGKKKALLPLVAIGLSPSLIYFNMLQTSFGLDLQYIVICIYFLIGLDFLQSKKAVLSQFFLWIIAMVGALSYPSFLVYLPFLWIIYGYKLWLIKDKLTSKIISMNILFSLTSFCIPFALIAVYLKDVSILFYDPHVKTGIFRAGGGISYPSSLSSLLENIIGGSKQVITDLFVKANSFYFETNIMRVEFSNRFIFLSVFTVLFLSILFLFKKTKYRLSILLAWLLIVFSMIITNISNWYPGLRRTTGVLTGFYILYILVWLATFELAWNKWKLAICVGIISCLLIPLHHLKVYPNNLLGLKLPSPHAQDACFNIIPHSPERSLSYFINQVTNTQKIIIMNSKGNLIDCRLHEIYAAVAGSCLWNNLNCQSIWGYDENTGDYILLSTSLWEDYYFNH